MTAGTPWTYPWVGWAFVLMEMHQGRRKLLQDLAGRPTWTCAGRPLPRGPRLNYRLEPPPLVVRPLPPADPRNRPHLFTHGLISGDHTMKISSNENHELVLEEVYGGVYLCTREGNMISVSMRDDTIEINVIPRGCTDHVNWWRVNMQKGTIEPMRAAANPDPASAKTDNDPGNAPGLASPKARKLKEGYQPIAPVGYKGPGKPPTGGSGVQRAHGRTPGW